MMMDLKEDEIIEALTYYGGDNENYSMWLEKLINAEDINFGGDHPNIASRRLLKVVSHNASGETEANVLMHYFACRRLDVHDESITFNNWNFLKTLKIKFDSENYWNVWAEEQSVKDEEQRIEKEGFMNDFRNKFIEENGREPTKEEAKKEEDEYDEATAIMLETIERNENNPYK